MSDLNVLLLYPHDDNTFFDRICEQALLQMGAITQRVPSHDKLIDLKESGDLNTPTIMIVDWHAYNRPTVYPYGPAYTFEDLRQLVGNDLFIIAITRDSRINRFDAKNSGLHGPVFIMRHFETSHTRYISNAAQLLAGNLKRTLDDAGISFLKSTSPSVIRYEIPEGRYISNFYGELLPLTPAVNMFVTPAERYIENKPQPIPAKAAEAFDRANISGSSSGGSAPFGGYRRRLRTKGAAYIAGQISHKAQRRAAIESAPGEIIAALVEMTIAALEQDEANRPNGTRSLNGSRCEP